MSFPVSGYERVLILLLNLSGRGRFGDDLGKIDVFGDL